MKDLKYYMALQYPVTLVQREHGGFFATHPDLSGCMAQGRTADEAIANLRDSREMWIEARLDSGYEVPEPTAEEFSGRFSLRLSPRLHGKLAQAAAREGVSLNQLITNVLAEYVGARSATEALRGNVIELIAQLAAASAQASSASISGENSGTADEPWLESTGPMAQAIARVVM